MSDMRKQVKPLLASGMPVKYPLMNFGLLLMKMAIRNIIPELSKTPLFTEHLQKGSG